MSAAKRIAACFGLALLLAAALAPVAARAEFGIESVRATARDRNGAIERRAGSHPHEWELSFEMNLDSEGEPEGTLRDLIVDLPAGMAGNPQAVPRCPQSAFDGIFPACPASSQVGIAHVSFGAAEARLPIYNLTPRLGVPASVGATIAGVNGILEASLRTGSDYGISVSDTTLPTEVSIAAVRASIWGVPADPSHDPDRHCFNSEDILEVGGCTSEAPELPFLTLPTSCAGPLVTTLHADSLQEPGVFNSKSAESLDEDKNPAGLINCEAPPFEPSILAQPETTVADSPTGLQVNLHLPQHETPEGIASAHLKDAVITLPAGMTVNASAADGRSACGSAQIDLHGPGPANCPDASKIGAVAIKAPALDHPVLGSVYLAKQGDNPFNSLLALYIAVDDPQTGVVVKLAGETEADPLTGQLRTVFLSNPQLPVEDVDVEIFGGPRAALSTPPTCGTYTTNATLTPWTSPEAPDAHLFNPFTVQSAPGGGPCAATEAQMPNAPGFEAGTVEPLAASFSPFVFKLSRENGSQRFGALNATLPPGLSAKLAGVSECSEAQIAQAKARANPGEGALEKASPSCPAASEVGVVNVGAGTGNPLYVQGHAYLAGPYKGAPLSLAIITPAVTGPFDLGTVAVRSALFVDESTAQVTVRSDPLPSILQGIPVDVRSIAVKVDRKDFSLNPTNCEEMAVSAQEISTTGQIAALSNRFQVGGCGGLGFSPKLSLSMKGATKRSGHPALRAVLTQPSGQANARRLSVALPATEFIDQNHISNPCTRPQFSEGRCPPASVLGTARVFTPLLDRPLEGPVYFRANGGERALPDVVLDLHGTVHVVQVGFVDSIHKKGSESSRIRTTFATIPDAPFSKAIIELEGGKKGLLVNSANICKVPNTAIVKMRAQNAKALDSTPKIATSCKKKK